MTDAMQRRMIGVAAVLVAAGALAWFLMADLGDNLVYYKSPTELMTESGMREATVRLGGLVVPGSVDLEEDHGTHLSFDVTDGTTTVHVESDGSPPQMFREGIGVVVEGKLGSDDVFVSDQVMVKHSDDYEAPEEGPVDMEKMNATLSKGDGG